MTVFAMLTHHLRRHGALGLLAVLVAGVVVAPAAQAADDLKGSISDVRVDGRTMTASLIFRNDKVVKLDPDSVRAEVGGKPAGIDTLKGEEQKRSTMLVIDTSSSMEASGMATVRQAVKEFLEVVPKDVKVGVVSFASTAGIDVQPTADHAKVSRAVGSLQAKGETSLYEAVQIAVGGLGTQGERSIVLLSDGGDTVAADQGKANADKERAEAVSALEKGNVRAEVISFNKGSDQNKAGKVLDEFATAGGGSVAPAKNSEAVTGAFSAAARALGSQTILDITLPQKVDKQKTTLEITGTASGQQFTVTTPVDLGDTSPVVVPSGGPIVAAATPTEGLVPLTAIDNRFLVPAIGVLTLGLFFLVVAFMAPMFRSRRSERVSAIEAYGFGKSPQRQAPTPSVIGENLVSRADTFMEGRESTTKTMLLLDRADLPWRAGEWLVLRMVAVIVAGAVGFLLVGSQPIIGGLIGAVLGLVIPPFVLRYLAKRRTKKFEAVLPDVLMLVATSLASGFSLLQALDAVAKDAPEPAAKEFSRALAEARIGADVSDALDHMAYRMQSQNMEWAVMAIRIQRDVGGNLAETLRTTAATLREREMLRRQVRALSAEGRLSAYILVALPIGILFYTMWANYEYVSLLWTTLMGIVMSIGGIVAMIIGIFWMRKVVQIEV